MPLYRTLKHVSSSCGISVEILFRFCLPTLRQSVSLWLLGYKVLSFLKPIVLGMCVLFGNELGFCLPTPCQSVSFWLPWYQLLVLPMRILLWDGRCVLLLLTVGLGPFGNPMFWNG